MSTKGRTGSPAEDIFWRAVEVAVGTLDGDIADVGRYVASRGDAAVAAFELELTTKLTALRGVGLREIIRQQTRTTDGRAFADLRDVDVDRGMQSLLLFGRKYFEILLTEPERERGPGVLSLVDLGRAVEAARSEPGIESAPLWLEEPGDRRADGTLWIELFQGIGMGVPNKNSPPWTVPGFRERFRKAAVLRSLDASWRDWRSTIGVRTLDVWLEYWLRGTEPERVDVKKRGRAASVVVYRDFSRLLAPGDPVSVAEREADAVFEEIRLTLAR